MPHEPGAESKRAAALQVLRNGELLSVFALILGGPVIASSACAKAMSPRNAEGFLLMSIAAAALFALYTTAKGTVA